MRRRGIKNLFINKLNWSNEVTARTVSSNATALWEKASLYIHWPYCEKRCTYCNFNKYIEKSVDDNRMKKCLVTELNTLLAVSQVKQITSVYFGGGTPSLASPTVIGDVLKAAKKLFSGTSGCTEVTLEINPTHAVLDKLQTFKQVGINRVSIGIQALADPDLQLLGRNHAVADSLRCLEQCRKLFPGKTSVDLIIGRPTQSLTNLKDELRRILALCDDHVSLYQLTLERGTELFKSVARGSQKVPSSSHIADCYELAVQTLESHRFTRYEVSNFARTQAAQSRHNISYWKGDQYIGIGPGAHGRFVARGNGGTTREARIQTLEPEPWMREVEAQGHATRKATPLSSHEVCEEILMLALRTKDGLSEKEWSVWSPVWSLSDIFGNCSRVEQLSGEGFLNFSNETLVLTSKGLAVADNITATLLTQLSDFLSCAAKTTIR